MMSASDLFRKHGSLVLVPLWAAFLLFPFTGLIRSLGFAIAIGGVLLAGKLVRSRMAAGAARRAGNRLVPLWSAAERLLSILKSPAAVGALLLLFIIAPLFQNNYYRDILTLTGMYAVLALGLNLVVGQTGLLNLGYVAFYAIGAYSYAILSTRFGLTFWPGMAVGALTASAFAVLVGIPTLRLRGDYFAIVTLGLGEITRIVLNNWDSVTRGPNGIAGIPRPVIAGYTLSKPLDFYYLILVILIVSIIAMRRLIASRIGRAWIAIREDETAAEAMGINTFRLKLLASVLASAWAGVVGVFFAAKMAFVSPESFTFFESVMILCMVVLGGMGSIPGIITGAFLLIALPELFREFQDYRMLAFGAALVLMMVFRPQGILGKTASTK